MILSRYTCERILLKKRAPGRKSGALFICKNVMARDFAKSFYRSKEWQQTREYILKRDYYLCVRCGKPAEEVHHKQHLSPENIGDIKITLNPDNLESLCRDCHFEEHRGEHANGRKNLEKTTEYYFDENGILRQAPPGVQGGVTA